MSIASIVLSGQEFAVVPVIVERYLSSSQISHYVVVEQERQYGITGLQNPCKEIEIIPKIKRTNLNIIKSFNLF